jgi:hypothetical protein
MRSFVLPAIVAGALTCMLPDRAAADRDDAAAVDEARRTFLVAVDAITKKDYPRARYYLGRVLASDAFTLMDEDERLWVLQSAGAAAVEQEEYGRAHGLYVRATELSNAAGPAWTGRLRAAQATKKHADSVLSLTTLAQKWPQQLDLFADEVIVLTAYGAGAPDVPQGARSNLHVVLLDAAEKSERFRNRSEMWLRLAGVFMSYPLDRDGWDHSEFEPFIVAGMRADRRYLSVVSANPKYFDVRNAADRLLDRLQQEWLAEPQFLSPAMPLLRSMPMLGMNEECIRMADATLDMRSKGWSSDRRDLRFYIVDYKSSALWEIGQFQQAIAELETPGRSKPVHRALRQIRIAWAYALAGYQAEALAAVRSLNIVDDYDWMEFETLLLVIAAQQQSEDATTLLLENLRKYSGPDFWTRQWALVAANRMDEAARTLTDNLRDPDRRLYTLINLQGYVEPTAAPWESSVQERWRALLARPDVQEAIAAVGRIEKYDIAMPADRARLGRPVRSLDVGSGRVIGTACHYLLTDVVTVIRDPRGAC